MLKELADAVSTAADTNNPAEPQTSPIVFHAAGGKDTWPLQPMSYETGSRGLLEEADDWKCSADLQEWGNPPEIVKRSGMRPDIVLYSSSAKKVLLIELTVPYESRMEESL